MDVLDELAVLMVVNAADDPTEALLDKLGGIVQQVVEDEETEGAALRRSLARHLVCTLLGMAATGLLDLQAAPDDLGDAVRAALIASGRSPLEARLGGAIATRGLSSNAAGSCAKPGAVSLVG